MEKFLNMPVLLGHITLQDIVELKAKMQEGCKDSKLILYKYQTEKRMFFADLGL